MAVDDVEVPESFIPLGWVEWYAPGRTLLLPVLRRGPFGVGILFPCETEPRWVDRAKEGDLFEYIPDPAAKNPTNHADRLG